MHAEGMHAFLWLDEPRREPMKEPDEVAAMLWLMADGQGRAGGQADRPTDEKVQADKAMTTRCRRMRKNPAENGRVCSPMGKRFVLPKLFPPGLMVVLGRPEPLFGLGGVDPSRRGRAG